MKRMLQQSLSIVTALVLLGASDGAKSQDAALEESVVLYKYDGKALRDSKWGKIPAFQQALGEHLQAAGKPPIKADAWFGKGTRRGIVALLSSPGYEKFAVPESHRLHGVVHSALWQRLLPETTPPTVHERAFALAFTHEATDFDRVEWNYDTADDKSALTWGPYGATVGWGNEVRAILQKVDDEDSGLVKSAFGDEYATVTRLLQAPASEGYAIMKEVHASETRRKQFKESLQKLGANRKTQEIYDAFAFQGNTWLKPNLKRLYSLVPDAATNATEIDYAFFLDLGMHAGISRSRIRKAKQAIADMESSSGRMLDSAQRRRTIANVFVNEINQRWRADRMGRDVVFYVDGIGFDNLRDDEKTAWQRRSRLKASNFGLSDTSKYYPDFLN